MKYQFLPRLADDEYQALEASILEHGVRVPILVDESGSVIDGYHRKEITDRHGLPCPTIHETDLSETQKRTLALSLNIDRRQLDRAQKRELVRRSLEADPNLSDRGHAARTGVDHKTVGSIRRGEIPHVPDAPLSAAGTVSTSPEVVEPVGEVTGDVEPPNTPSPVTVNPATGEVVDAPTVMEHTVTEKTRTVVGLDGKTYEQKPNPPKDRRRSLVDDAYRANTDLWKAIERIRTIRSDDRFTRNKADVVAALQPSVDLALEVLSDL